MYSLDFVVIKGGTYNQFCPVGSVEDGNREREVSRVVSTMLFCCHTAIACQWKKACDVKQENIHQEHQFFWVLPKKNKSVSIYIK